MGGVPATEMIYRVIGVITASLLVVSYERTNLTLRRLGPLLGISKSAADRVIDHLGPLLAIQPRRRFAKDAVLIVDGTFQGGALGNGPALTQRGNRPCLQRQVSLLCTRGYLWRSSG